MPLTEMPNKTTIATEMAARETAGVHSGCDLEDIIYDGTATENELRS